MRNGEVHDGEIIEAMGDKFSKCHFFNCEFTGGRNEFLDCVFVDSFGIVGVKFVDCLFWVTKPEDHPPIIEIDLDDFRTWDGEEA